MPIDTSIHIFRTDWSPTSPLPPPSARRAGVGGDDLGAEGRDQPIRVELQLVPAGRRRLTHPPTDHTAVINRKGRGATESCAAADERPLGKKNYQQTHSTSEFRKHS